VVMVNKVQTAVVVEPAQSVADVRVGRETVVGKKAQVVFAGNPLHENDTVPVMPPAGIRLSCVCTVPPCGTVRTVGEAVAVKLGGMGLTTRATVGELEAA